MLMTEDALVLKWFPSVMLMGTAVTMTTGVGINWSLLSLGSGMLVGLRINASMLLGTSVAWIVAPYALLHYGVITERFTRNDVLLWVMWPAILLSLPLMLVGLRVLGETNWAPVSALSNMMQGIFGILAPGHIPANMIASGTTGTIAAESEAVMQDVEGRSAIE